MMKNYFFSQKLVIGGYAIDMIDDGATGMQLSFRLFIEL